MKLLRNILHVIPPQTQNLRAHSYVIVYQFAFVRFAVKICTPNWSISCVI